jgi:hypothetical protein
MMSKTLMLTLAIVFTTHSTAAQEAATEDEVVEPTTTVEETIAGSDQPKTMSGMSILGNEEAPKALVIIPWKSSELGDDIKLSDTLDDRAQPVDKEVFLRSLSFYAIRSGNAQE